MNLIFDAIDSSHQQSREGEVGVGRGIGEACFDSLGLRALIAHGNANGGGGGSSSSAIGNVVEQAVFILEEFFLDII